MTTTTTRDSSATKLNQIVAITAGTRTRFEQALTRAYHQIQKPAPFAGIARTYRRRDDEGAQLPPESTLVQVRATDLIADVGAQLARMLDVMATQDTTNCMARADLVVHGKVLLSDVPVTFLMPLEKVVVNLRTFIGKLPTLDVASTWSFDPDANAYATDPVETTKTKKVPKNHVKAPATDKHPAQVEMFTEDEVIGYWRTVHFSGALPGSTVMDMLTRIEHLLDGIRFAREQANSIPVTDVKAGDPIVSYLLRV
jgi:hypothetical protein